MGKPLNMDKSNSPEINQALVNLSIAVLPVWNRQLVTSRSQSEAAVSEMLSAFAAIGPHLTRASRQSGQITAALAHGDSGITQLTQACKDELAPVLDSLNPQAAQAVQRVMSMIQQSVDALDQIAKPFAHETQMVSQQVERMYIGFQYQDRISQMMSLLHDDIERLHAALQHPLEDAAALAPQEWLARLESQYAMAEQRLNHNAQTATDSSPQVGADDDSIFF
jgi:methyl-accepting chemotaxis protein